MATYDANSRQWVANDGTRGFPTAQAAQEYERGLAQSGQRPTPSSQQYGSGTGNTGGRGSSSAQPVAGGNQGTYAPTADGRGGTYTPPAGYAAQPGYFTDENFLTQAVNTFQGVDPLASFIGGADYAERATKGEISYADALGKAFDRSDFIGGTGDLVRAVGNEGSAKDRLLRAGNAAVRPIITGPLERPLEKLGLGGVQDFINPGGQAIFATQDEILDRALPGGSYIQGPNVPGTSLGEDPASGAGAGGYQDRAGVRATEAIDDFVTDTIPAGAKAAYDLGKDAVNGIYNAGKDAWDYIRENAPVNTNPTEPAFARPTAPSLGGGFGAGGGAGGSGGAARPPQNLATPSGAAQQLANPQPGFSSQPQQHQTPGFQTQSFQGGYQPQSSGLQYQSTVPITPDMGPQERVAVQRQNYENAVNALNETRGKYDQELAKLSEIDPFGSQAFLQKATDRAVAQAAGTAAGVRGGRGAQMGASRVAASTQNQLTARGIQEMEEARVRDAIQAASLRGQALQGVGALDTSRLNTETAMEGLNVEAQRSNQADSTNRKAIQTQAETAREGIRASDIASQRQEHTALEGYRAADINSQRVAHTQQQAIQQAEVASQRLAETARMELSQRDIESMRQVQVAAAELTQRDVESLRNLETQFAQIDQQRYATDMAYQTSVDNNLMRQYDIDTNYAIRMEEIVRDSQFSLKDVYEAVLQAGLGLTISDERAKTGIRKAAPRDVREFAKSGRGSTYRYKDRSHGGVDEHFGPMAQDLERTKLGRKLVREGPDGVKRVDTYRLALADHAAIAQLAEDLEKLKKGRKVKTRRAS
jgi:hypothetical protein